MKARSIVVASMAVLMLEYSAKAEVLTLAPTATGTIRHSPELGILDRAPVGGGIQSTYFRTTEMNREFRRGFLEFAIPDISGEIAGATLVLPEHRAWTSHPLPPDVHGLAYYPADLIVNTDDFDRPTTFLAFFETDVNLPTETFSFDVTTLVREFQTRQLGFRIKLESDPLLADYGAFGSGISEPVHSTPPRIEVTVVPEPSTLLLLGVAVAVILGFRLMRRRG